MEELKPCPFCGKIPKVTVEKHKAWVHPYYEVTQRAYTDYGIVHACLIEMNLWRRSMSGLIKVWNRRHDG